MRIGLSGTGRIGRLCIRKLLSAPNRTLELAVINSTSPVATLAHLLKYDSVHGTWDAEVSCDETGLIVNGRHLPVISEWQPEQIHWKHYNVDLVIDATGKFNDRDGANKHLLAGAERVLVTAPGRGMDLTVVMGVNEQLYHPESHRLLSTASCTTNCIAPILNLLDHTFGVRRGWMTTVHSFTSDQNHLDNPHKDLRRARSCTNAIIPTSTGVGKALADILPHLAPHLKGLSVRVPTQNVSLLDLQVQLACKPGPTDIRECFQQAAQGTLGKYVGYNELPLVSSDYIGNEKSATVDGLSMMLNGDQLKILAWYDNEWAYSCRVIDFAMHMAETGYSSRKVTCS
ncbi:type I glyceraldehyde-3-phosphate dehydrogenase [Paenibacillus sp. J2TS4]|uniref:type I glyceraldehyde-3-phosphate dehydrogenase n=1 Tax=Paenibacillus sp. J2TS4 TaxID=2807194 RepID=UPI001B21C760|nr:type I glyceraldehyde-3-phosphate dehydrogenase [Paenibacillus sp. J2TS4]GIP31863.1 glyceraldehyde-3-phosphate dehydrogenase 2 [Paenibacillus sp. J2TS4]